MPDDYVSYAHAGIVAAGGVIGYAKAGSIPSLIAGLAFGGILGYGAYQNSQFQPKPLVSLATSLFLAGFMGHRWNRSGKILPSGVVCLLSAAVFARNLFLYQNYLNLPGSSRW